MTREEAKQYINYYYCHTELLDEYGDYCDQTEYEEAFDMAIKALEQEPILDKIRAEIDQYLFQNEFGSAYRKEVSQIIDKYKAESEVDS